LAADARQVPSSMLSASRFEFEQPFLGHRHEELDREEWIAAGLLVHQLALEGRTQSCSECSESLTESAKGRRARGAQARCPAPFPSLANRRQRPHERAGWTGPRCRVKATISRTCRTSGSVIRCASRSSCLPRPAIANRSRNSASGCSGRANRAEEPAEHHLKAILLFLRSEGPGRAAASR